MNKTEYQAYRQSPKWSKKRRQALYWHKNRCAVCGKKRVDVHHKTYKGVGGNEDPKWHLVPLCRKHHYAAHAFAKANGMSLYHGTLEYIKRYAVKRPKLWGAMTLFERQAYIGKGL